MGWLLNTITKSHLELGLLGTKYRWPRARLNKACMSIESVTVH